MIGLAWTSTLDNGQNAMAVGTINETAPNLVQCSQLISILKERRDNSSTLLVGGSRGGFKAV